MPNKKREWAAGEMAQLAKAGVEEMGRLSRMELEVEGEKRRIGQERMDAQLAALPAEDEKPKACPRCRKRVRVRAKGVAREYRGQNIGDRLLFRIRTDKRAKRIPAKK